MKQPPPKLRLGTCSWKYDSWKGLTYDPDRNYSPDDYLPDYAEHFDTVEIDQWFWSLFATGAKLPDPDTVKIYADSVPDDFLFTVKAPNSITLTNYYSKQPAGHKHLANKPNDNFLSTDLLKRFLETLRPMGSKLGTIMFQFEYLNKQKMPSLGQFLDRLNEFFSAAPKGFDFGLEIRNPNYLKDEYFEFLKQAGLSPVLIEGYYMPHIGRVAENFDISSGKTLLLRLMGPDRSQIEKLTGEKWNKIAAPKDRDLDSIAKIVRQQLKNDRDVTVNVNNHYEGSAILTIERLTEKLK